jgi:hypothetical protein
LGGPKFVPIRNELNLVIRDLNAREVRSEVKGGDDQD